MIHRATEAKKRRVEVKMQDDRSYLQPLNPPQSESMLAK